YAASVRLGADSATVAAASDTSDDVDDPATLHWRAEALRELRAFLAQHPNSAARGEVRFRLADLELVEARRAFRDAMGRYVAAGGDPQSGTYFRRLVDAHPDSRYAQEAWLRMGDARFDEHRFAECVPLYARAAQGADPGLRAIALYKTGWAHFNEERFAAAA